MKTTFWQKAFARHWHLKTYFSVWFIGVGIRYFPALQLSTWTLSNWVNELRMVISIILLIPVVWFVGTMVLVIPPVLFLHQYVIRKRVRMNGGPFKSGDLVWILAGKHRGKSGRVRTRIQHSGQQEDQDLGLLVQLSGDQGETIELEFGQQQLLIDRESR